MTTFAERMYMALPETDEIFFSPLSIWSALSRAAIGARGNTRRQMADLLGLPSTDAGVIEDIFRIDSTMVAVPDITLAVANRLYAENSYAFRLEYLYHMVRVAGFKPANFRNASEAERKEINKWVMQMTRDKIDNLLPPGAVTSRTRMVIVNAVYFKAPWASQFKFENTHPADFYLLNGRTAKVQLMTQQNLFAYGEDEYMQVLMLPYKGFRVARLVMLPKQGVPLREAEQHMARMGLLALMDSLNEAKVRVFAPKYEKGWGVTNLKPVLMQLGMIDAFDDEKADFSGATQPGEKPLVIDAVYHKAWGRDTEEGSEATAATAVTSRESFSIAPPPRNVEVRMDRPYVYAMVDLHLRETLFMGRMLNPAG